MQFLVIGLGSMGKRRVRNLIALGFKSHIIGFDLREDRREEAQKYEIEIINNLNNFDFTRIDAFIISTPPNLHMYYADIAYKNNVSAFIEASVVDAQKILELSKKTKEQKILMAPSCTMRYFSAPKKIKELVRSNAIGQVLNFNYHTGQYLPDWHPWEKIENFYVSNPNTGGAREIVPFELTWINDIFGDAEVLACVRRKLTQIPADIEDIYHAILEYPKGIIGNLTVEVISRPEATREMRILGTQGEIIWSGSENYVKYKTISMNEWQIFSFKSGTIEANYINPEEPYINEIKDFIQGVKAMHHGQKSYYQNSLEDDYKILQTLYKLEDISEGRDGLSR